MKVKLLIPAHTIIADIQSKRASAINIIEPIVANTFPIQIPCMVFVLIERTMEEPVLPEIFIKILANDTVIVNGPLNISFQDGKLNAKTVCKFPSLMIHTAGILTFSIIFNNVVISEYTVPIRLKDAAQAVPLAAG